MPSRLLTNREESSRNIDKQVVRIAKATPGPSTTAKAEKPLIGNFSTGYQTEIPTKETELFQISSEPVVAIFYTIWSYAPGAGRTLIFDAVKHIKENKPEIQRYVTLSPKTEMAKRFHMRNGAVVFRENDDTVNYEYHRVIL